MRAHNVACDAGVQALAASGREIASIRALATPLLKDHDFIRKPPYF
jgi:hypothetical protein